MKKILVVLGLLVFASCKKEEVSKPALESVLEYNETYNELNEGYYKNYAVSGFVKSMISEFIKEDGVIVWKSPYELITYEYNGYAYYLEKGHRLEIIDNETIKIHFSHGLKLNYYLQ